ncbi:GDP-mannose-dependent alpha-(1-6)-phosphatidylinositol monomannoside mannosyltransferase [Luteitalea pratensis]|uniref:GDP-mannose-dependent alpha-(1-6)-phosphatidylinositol monomannoside mannosyltransferase n=1 Tax=Luteitalea pratensis TaxID=1855912 RepID=A0A143PYX6_LUTPR|nr:glycosyltransferase family 4 protein [Luteitalea pratensis]AMY12979.1 GDP-mannose-dependent alpha-(1-6)-phosphatidylinositol monomannoside mannosyltransferase [Luteitalea pratensis]
MSTPLRRPLRVCHLAYTFHESDNRVMRYVRTLAARGDQVDVIALRPAGSGRRADEGTIRVYQIQRRSTTERAAWMYLLKLLWFWLKSMSILSWLQVRRRYDVVHVHNVPDFLVFAAWLPKVMGARLILDIHDMMPELYAGKFAQGRPSKTFGMLAALERLSCRFADHVIASNDLWVETLNRRSAAADKCTVFINHPDLTLFRPRQRARPDGAPFVFLYPGSLNHHQGVDLAVRAFAAARSQMPSAELHIYGRGPALPLLHDLVKELHLGEAVRIKDFLPSVQIAEVMSAADVGVVPKRADGFGNEAFSTKILEFMACGVPVIVARTRIDAHYFTDALVNFFEPGDVESLAGVMRQVYAHAAEQVGRIEAAREFAGHQSWQARRADYERLVDALASFNRTAALHAS